MWIEINPASCEPEKEKRIYDLKLNSRITHLTDEKFKEFVEKQ